jgi:tetratricopeptide (TPR) repeat protein
MNNDELRKLSDAIMVKAVKLKAAKKYTEALFVIDEFIKQELTPEILIDILGMRAIILHDLEDYKEEKIDLLKILKLSEKIAPIERKKYLQHVAQMSIGSIDEELGNLDGALSWYMKSLYIALESETTSGGVALKLFLKLREKNLTDAEKELCKKVIDHAWKLFKIEGSPDYLNLKETTEVICKKHGDKIKR